MKIQEAGRAVLAAVLMLWALPLVAQPGEPGSTRTSADAPSEAAGEVVEAADGAPSPGPAADCCLVPARTPVVIEIVEPVGSRESRTGQSFALRLAEPLVVDGRTLAPTGAPGMGEVVHAARARVMGRAGELILAARWIEVGGVRIRLRSLRMDRRQGEDPTNALAVGSMVPIVSMFMPFVSGGNIEVPAGTFAEAMTAAETMLPPLDENISPGEAGPIGERTDR